MLTKCYTRSENYANFCTTKWSTTKNVCIIFFSLGGGSFLNFRRSFCHVLSQCDMSDSIHGPVALACLPSGVLPIEPHHIAYLVSVVSGEMLLIFLCAMK